MAIEKPVEEAQYALDKKSALKLYDCLVPEIAAYRPLKLKDMSIDTRTVNYQAKLELAYLDKKSASWKLPLLVKENSHLVEQNKRLNEDLEIVRWYIAIMEQGRNSKTLLKDFLAAQEEIRKLKDHIKTSKADFGKKIDKLTEELRLTYEKLLKLSNEVVKPLLE